MRKTLIEIEMRLNLTALMHAFLFTFFTQKYTDTDLPQIGAILEKLVAPWVRSSCNTRWKHQNQCKTLTTSPQGEENSLEMLIDMWFTI